jgi:deoxyribodipyrimidine photo-lyase
MSHHKPEMKPVICWFRQDFRFADNPALTAAIATGQPALCVDILDDEAAGRWRTGGGIPMVASS